MFFIPVLRKTTLLIPDGKNSNPARLKHEWRMGSMMPVMDGMGTTRLIHGLSGPEANIQIIALTAHAMQGYVSKPVRAAELFSALTVHLGIEPQSVTSSA